MSRQVLRCSVVSLAVAAICLVLGQAHMACWANPNSRALMLPLEIHNLTNSAGDTQHGEHPVHVAPERHPNHRCESGAGGPEESRRVEHPAQAVGLRSGGPANARRNSGGRLRPASHGLVSPAAANHRRRRKYAGGSSVHQSGGPAVVGQPQGGAGTTNGGPETAGSAGAKEVGGSLSGVERCPRPTDLLDGYSWSLACKIGTRRSLPP